MRSAWLCVVLVILLPTRAAAAPASAPSDAKAPVIEHSPIRQSAPKQAIEVSAQIRDVSGVAFPRLYYRTVGRGSYNQATLVARGDRYVAIIPAFSVSSSGVEYYLEAFDKKGNGPAHHGSKQKPHRIDIRDKVAAPPPAATASTPWYKRWWIWAIGGAVVAGSVTAIALAARGDDKGTATGATLVINAAAPAPTLPGL